MSVSYLKINMVFATSIIKLILPLEYHIFREYSRKNFSKILKIANFMNFLLKNDVFCVFYNLQRLFRIFLNSKQLILGLQLPFEVAGVFNTPCVVYITFLKYVG